MPARSWSPDQRRAASARATARPSGESIGPREARVRYWAVRWAKVEKARAGGEPDLTPDELDAILDPVECLRTACRAAGVPYREGTRTRAGAGKAVAS